MKPHGRETIGHEAHDRSRGAATTLAGRLRVAAGLCSVLFAALWLPGCESTIVFDPKMTVTAETVLREAGPPLALTVRVSPAPANDLIYHVEMDAAGCVLPERLRQPRTVTIAAGDQEVTLTVRTDDIEMNAESCTLTVMVTEGDEVDESYTADTLHVTVVITVPAEVTVTAGTSPVEEGDDVTFTLTATPAPAEPLTVSVNWSETGSYLDGTPESTVTIPVSGTFTVSASTEDDSADEADGTVTLTVAGGDGYTVGTPSSAMVTVTDNDGPPVPVVSVAAGTSPVVEGADVEFTLTATPTPAAPLTVSVSWSESGSYLTGTRRSEVTIPTTGTVTVSASTEDDGTDEADGTVTLTVAGGDGYTIGAPSSATVTVTDDDVPAVSVAAGTSPVDEGDDVSFTLTATPAPAAPLTVAVSWSETGSFLTGTRPSEVTIPASGTATVTASTEDDDADEPDGTVTLTVGGGSGYTVGTPSATVTVTDNDGPPVPAVSVAAGTSPVVEGTAVEFTLTATPAPAAPLAVAVSWSETGSYLDGTPESTVTIPASGTATVSASTEDDGTDEMDGAVTLTVDGGDGYRVGTPSSATVTVTDDDVPAVSVAAGTSSVEEGDDVEFTLTATPAPAEPLTVAVSWSETGSYLDGTPESTVTIPVSGTATVTASTEDDGADEADGTVTLTVDSGDGYTVGTPSSADVTVTDNDVLPAVSVTAGTSPVTEGTAVEFTLTATPAPAEPLTVSVSWSETGSYLDGTPESTVTIPVSGTFTVTASTEDDGTDEADGTVTLTVDSGDGYTVGTPSSADVTVNDDDVPEVSVKAGTSPVTEGQAVTFTLTADPAPAEPLAVSVRWSETGTSSLLPETRRSEVAIPTSGRATVSVTTKDNPDPHPGRGYEVITLTVTAGNGYTVGTPDSAEVRVSDDDGG